MCVCVCVCVCLCVCVCVSWLEPTPHINQRRRDNNKNKIFAFEGGGPWRQRGKLSKNAGFRGKRHDNKILKVEILLSRHFVVIAQAPNKMSLVCLRAAHANGHPRWAYLRNRGCRNPQANAWYRSIQNYYPRIIIFYELIRRGVIYYAGKFSPQIISFELIMRGNSASHYVD